MVIIALNARSASAPPAASDISVWGIKQNTALNHRAKTVICRGVEGGGLSQYQIPEYRPHCREKRSICFIPVERFIRRLVGPVFDEPVRGQNFIAM